MNRGNRNSVSTVDYLEWKQRSSSFQGINAWTSGSFNVGGGERPEQVAGSLRTPGFFTMEGLPFMLGRDFTSEEGQPGRDHVVVLSNRLWERSFASNRDIIARTSDLMVSPTPSLFWPRNSRSLQLTTVPLLFHPIRRSGDAIGFGDGALERQRVERSGPGEMSGIEQLIEERGEGIPIGVSVEALHLNFLTEATRRNLWLLLGAVGLLLIACVNVANLPLARALASGRCLRAALAHARPPVRATAD
jgi:putative ABC transport system permease protein